MLLPATPDDLGPALEALGRHLDATWRAWLRSLPSPKEFPGLTDALAYGLGVSLDGAGQPGKRLRPAMCLWAAQALGGVDARDRSTAFSLAIELMHTFALVHDDVQDGDTQRRGQPSVWAKYGIPVAVNVGDYALTLAFRVLARHENTLPDAPASLRAAWVELMAETVERTIQGQALDIAARAGRRISMAAYERIVSHKTGHYLAAPLLGGAMAAGADANVLDLLIRLGQELGPLFQVRDDVIDLTVGKGRDRIGSDIREGKRSFMVAWMCETAPEAIVERLMDILDLPGEETGPNHIDEAIRLFRVHGALAAADAQLHEREERALAVAGGAPEPLRGVLLAMVRALRDRQH